jgi:hypothetical protein
LRQTNEIGVVTYELVTTVDPDAGDTRLNAVSGGRARFNVRARGPLEAFNESLVGALFLNAQTSH